MNQKFVRRPTAPHRGVATGDLARVSFKNDHPDPTRLGLREGLPLSAAWALLRVCNDEGCVSMLVVTGNKVAIQFERAEDAQLIARDFPSLLVIGGKNHAGRR